jgi:hypothetical protein
LKVIVKPLLLHAEPLVLTLTGNPEEAVAETVKDDPTLAVAGGGCNTVIV